MTKIYVNTISKSEEEKLLASYNITTKKYTYTPIPTRSKLDLYQEFDIELNYLISDIRDIKTKRSSYSKTITIPDTPNNRKCLGFITEFSSSESVNPKLQSKCYVYNEDTLVFNGWIQFRNIKSIVEDGFVIGNEIECQIYSANYNLASVLGDIRLSDLDWSSFNDLTYTRQGIIDSWDTSKGSEIYYPLIDYGWALTKNDISNSLEDKGVYMENFYPALSYKTYIDKIFATAGYNYNSEFLSSNLFKDMIVPYNGETFMKRKDISTRVVGGITETGSFSYNKYFRVGKTTGQTLSTTVGSFDRYIQSRYGPSSKYAASHQYNINFDNTTTAGIIDNSNGLFTSSTVYGKTKTHFQQKGSISITDANYKQRFVIGLRVYNPDSVSTGAGLFANILQINVVVYRSFNNSGVFVSNFDAPSTPYSIPAGTVYGGTGVEVSRINIYDEAKKQKTDEPLFRDEEFTYEAGELEIPGLGTKYGFNATIKFNPFDNSSYISNINPTKNNQLISQEKPLRPGEKLSFAIEVVRWTDASYNPFSTANLVIEPTQTYLYNDVYLDVIPDGRIDLDQIVPQDVKAIDFLTDCVNAFNLYLEPSNDDDKTLYVEPREIYYSQGKVVDWSNKLDLSKEIETQIIADISKRKTIFSLKDDTNSYTTKTYKQKTGQIYGQYTYDTRNYNTLNEEKVSLNIMTVPLTTQRDQGSVLPTQDLHISSFVKDYNTIKYTGYPNMEITNTGYTILFRKNLTFGQDVYPYKGMIFYYQNNKSSQRFSYYPYAGQFDDPIRPSFDLNFAQGVFGYYGSKANSDYAEYPPDNLYTFGWKNFLAEMTDKDSKLIKCYIKLDPQDISKLRFNQRVFLKTNDEKLNLNNGAYFYINNITGYNPSVEDSYEVELLLTNGSNTINQVPKSTGSTTGGGSSSDTGSGSTGTMIGGVSGTATSSSSTPASYFVADTFTLDSKKSILGLGNKTLADNIKIVGDNNTISVSASGSIVLGSNMEIENAGIIYFDKPMVQYFTVMDGGENVTLDPYAENTVYIADGGENVNREIGSTTPIIWYDGGETIL